MSGQEYVTRIVAEAGSTGSENDVLKESEGCQIIGHWNPTHAKDGNDAKSWTSNRTGGTWAALYQCKEPCPNKQCTEIRIRAIELPGTPNVKEAGDATGDSISLERTFPNCGDKAYTYAADLNIGHSYTDEHSYTLSKAVTHSFECTISDSITITATMGVDPPLGEKEKSGISNKITVSEDMAWTNTIKHTDTTIKKATKAVSFSDQTIYEVPAGHVTRIKVKMMAIQYSTDFVAEADCLDKGGNVIETTQLGGVFKGKVYRQTSDTKTETLRSCTAQDIKCSSSG